jgi:hypothetical protein
VPSPEELSVTARKDDLPGDGESALMTVAGQWQVRFDGGHPQRYLADRAAVLRYVLAVAPHAASSRFEVYAEAEPVLLADGSPGGRQFALAEVIDFARPGEADRLRAELTTAPELPT